MDLPCAKHSKCGGTGVSLVAEVAGFVTLTWWADNVVKENHVLGTSLAGYHCGG